MTDIGPETVAALAVDLRRGSLGGKLMLLGGVQHDERCLAAADLLEALAARLAELEVLAAIARWNVTEGGGLVRVCRGEHEKGEDCAAHEEVFVPRERLDAAEAEVAQMLRDARNDGREQAAAVADDYERRWNATAYDRRQNGKDDNFACASASASTHIGIAIRNLKEPTDDQA